MKKVKFFIASLIGVVALIFSCVLRTSVKAAENENSYFYSTKTVASGSKVKTAVEGEQLGNSIFYVISSSGKLEYKKVGSDYPEIISNYLSSVYISSGSDNKDDCIKFTCTEAGKIKFLAYSKDAARTITLYDSNFNVHSSNQSYTLDSANTDFAYFDIKEAGTYYLHHDHSLGYYHLEFIDNTALNSTVTALQQESSNLIDGYRYIRFIFIIDGKSLSDDYVKSRFYLQAKDGNKVSALNCLPRVVGRITSNGEDFTAEVNGEEYTFSKKNNVTYVVFTVKFTPSKYSKRAINASLYYKGETFETTPYVFD